MGKERRGRAVTGRPAAGRHSMSGVHDDLDTIRITVGTANPVANVMACVDRVEAEIARLDRIVSSHISRADRREGMVVAYDYEGEYVGCMGRNTWQWLIDTGVTEAEIDRLREERDMARAGRDQWERFAIGRGVVQYELLARAQAAEAENTRLREERDAAINDIRAVHAQGQEVAATAVRNALTRLERKLKSVEAERDAIGAALGEPCAECGHIDWRSDGYADRFVAEAEAAANGWRGLFSEATERAEAAEARCARLEAERNEYAERLQWLRELRESEGSWGKPYERAMAVSDPRGGEPYECEEERDQLGARCARLQQALRNGVRVASHYMDTGRGDLDGWIAQAEALAGLDTTADTPPSGWVCDREDCQGRPGDSRKESYSDKLRREGGMAASGKFREDTPADSQEDKT